MTNILKLVEGDGAHSAVYDWKTYRFLLSDGSCFDVVAIDDNSWLRDEVLKIANKVDKINERKELTIIISGVAEIKATSTERRPVKLPAKKTPAKKAP